MTHTTVLAGIIGAEFAFERLGHVVGVHDRHLGDTTQSVGAEHLDITVGDGQQQGVAVGRREHGRDPLLAAGGNHRVRRQELDQMLGHADRTHAGTAAAVRHGKGLVEVQVAHVGPDVTGIGKSHLGIHVGTVHEDQTAGIVYGIHQVANPALENAVGRGIGNHGTAKFGGIGRSLGLEVLDIDIALRVAVHDHDLHSGHRCRRGVGTVCRRRNQDGGPVALAAALVVSPDGHQTGILARRTRFGLQRAPCETGNGSQVVFEFLDHLQIPFHLRSGRKGVYVGEFGQRKGHHLHGGIQLHGARSERYHAVGKRYVAPFETLDVTHHLRLAVVLVEYGSVEYRIGTQQRRIDRHLRLVHLHALGRLLSGGFGEHGNHLRNLLGRGHLVEAHPYGTLVRVVEVDVPCECGILHHGSLRLHLQRIEVISCGNLVTELGQSSGHRCGVGMDVLCDPAQPPGTVVCGIESRHGRYEGRRGTYIGRRLLALDVLLTRLERHAQRLVAEPVHRYADDTTGHVAFVSLLGGHEAGRRATEAHRQTEPLYGTHRDVGAPLARRGEQHEAHQIAHGSHLRTRLVSSGGECRIVADAARRGRILHDGTELPAGELVGVVVVADDFDTEGFAARHEHVEYLREDVVVHEQLVAAVLHLLARTQGEHHQHRLGSGARIVQQRAVADLHTGEGDGHRLKVQERFEAALRDLGLIGRIGGVPCGVLENVAHDDGRSGRRVPTHTDERTHLLVLGRQFAYVCRKLILGHPFSGQRDGFAQADGGRNDLRDQFVHAGNADHIEHLLQIGFRNAYVAIGKFIERHNFGEFII